MVVEVWITERDRIVGDGDCGDGGRVLVMVVVMVVLVLIIEVVVVVSDGGGSLNYREIGLLVVVIVVMGMESGRVEGREESGVIRKRWIFFMVVVVAAVG